MSGTSARALRVGLGVVVALAVLVAVGRLFVDALGGGAGSDQLVGVQLTPPPGFVVVERGALSRPAAARELSALLSERPREARLGLHFTAEGSELFWLVERDGDGGAVLRELAAGAAGTRVETTWGGTAPDLERRLAWAAEHGSLELPDLRRGESRNLYH